MIKGVLQVANFGKIKARYFKESEFACKCCGRVMIDNRLVTMLDRVRHTLDKPIYVNSGYRCVAHNKAVGGATGSYHVKGLAADITAHCDLKRLQRLCFAAGIPTAVIYHRQGFIHVDLGTPRTWAT